jgi:hypothetical protein
LAITLNPNIQGSLKSDLSYITNLNYDIDDGKYIFSISYAKLCLNYEGNSNDPYKDLNARLNSFILSSQYNGEKLSLTAEYALQWSHFNN